MSPSTMRTTYAGVVAAAAVLGLASIIHPSNSSAIPSSSVPLVPSTGTSTATDAVSLGSLETRDAVAELYAATPEPLCDVEWAGEWDTSFEGIALPEFLRLEGAPVSGDQGLTAWPDAFMQVDVGGEW